MQYISCDVTALSRLYLPPLVLGRPERSLADLQRLLVHPSGLLRPTQAPVRRRQSVHAVQGVGMLRPERSLADHQRLLV